MDAVDLKLLVTAAAKRNAGLPEKELAKLVAANFRFIFFNKVNNRNFLMNPPPEHVVDRMVQILQLNSQIGFLIREGRRMVIGGAPGEDKLKVIREIGQLGKKLGQVFREYFMDIRHSSYRLHIHSFDDVAVVFVHYLIQLDRINRHLGQEIDHYFFNPAPGAIDLSEYQDYSVATLCESIVKLSTLAERGLGR